MSSVRQDSRRTQSISGGVAAVTGGFTQKGRNSKDIGYVNQRENSTPINSTILQTIALLSGQNSRNPSGILLMPSARRGSLDYLQDGLEAETSIPKGKKHRNRNELNNSDPPQHSPKNNLNMQVLNLLSVLPKRTAIGEDFNQLFHLKKAFNEEIKQIIDEFYTVKREIEVRDQQIGIRTFFTGDGTQNIIMAANYQAYLKKVKQQEDQIELKFKEWNDLFPLTLFLRYDGNTLFRACIIRYVLTIIMSGDEPRLEGFLKKIQQLPAFYYSCLTNKAEMYKKLSDKEVKAVFIIFVTKQFQLNKYDETFKLDKLVKEFNADPLIDFSAVLVARMLAFEAYKKIKWLGSQPEWIEDLEKTEELYNLTTLGRNTFCLSATLIAQAFDVCVDLIITKKDSSDTVSWNKLSCSLPNSKHRTDTIHIMCNDMLFDIMLENHFLEKHARFFGHTKTSEAVRTESVEYSYENIIHKSEGSYTKILSQTRLLMFFNEKDLLQELSSDSDEEIDSSKSESEEEQSSFSESYEEEEEEEDDDEEEEEEDEDEESILVDDQVDEDEYIDQFSRLEVLIANPNIPSPIIDTFTEYGQKKGSPEIPINKDKMKKKIKVPISPEDQLQQRLIKKSRKIVQEVDNMRENYSLDHSSHHSGQGLYNGSGGGIRMKNDSVGLNNQSGSGHHQQINSILKMHDRIQKNIGAGHEKEVSLNSNEIDKNPAQGLMKINLQPGINMQQGEGGSQSERLRQKSQNSELPAQLQEDLASLSRGSRKERMQNNSLQGVQGIQGNDSMKQLITQESEPYNVKDRLVADDASPINDQISVEIISQRLQNTRIKKGDKKTSIDQSSRSNQKNTVDDNSPSESEGSSIRVDDIKHGNEDNNNLSTKDIVRSKIDFKIRCLDCDNCSNLEQEIIVVQILKGVSMCNKCLKEKLNWLIRNKQQKLFYGKAEIYRFMISDMILQMSDLLSEYGSEDNSSSDSDASTEKSFILAYSQEIKETPIQNTYQKNNTKSEAKLKSISELREICASCNRYRQKNWHEYVELKGGIDGTILLCRHCLWCIVKGISNNPKQLFIKVCEDVHISPQQSLEMHEKILSEVKLDEQYGKCQFYCKFDFVWKKKQSFNSKGSHFDTCECEIVSKKICLACFERLIKSPRVNLSDFIALPQLIQILEVFFQRDFRLDICIACNENYSASNKPKNIRTYTEKQIGNQINGLCKIQEQKNKFYSFICFDCLKSNLNSANQEAEAKADFQATVMVEDEASQSISESCITSGFDDREQQHIRIIYKRLSSSFEFLISNYAKKQLQQALKAESNKLLFSLVAAETRVFSATSICFKCMNENNISLLFELENQENNSICSKCFLQIHSQYLKASLIKNLGISQTCYRQIKDSILTELVAEKKCLTCSFKKSQSTRHKSNFGLILVWSKTYARFIYFCSACAREYFSKTDIEGIFEASVPQFSEFILISQPTNSFKRQSTLDRQSSLSHSNRASLIKDYISAMPTPQQQEEKNLRKSLIQSQGKIQEYLSSRKRINGEGDSNEKLEEKDCCYICRESNKQAVKMLNCDCYLCCSCIAQASDNSSQLSTFICPSNKCVQRYQKADVICYLENQFEQQEKEVILQKQIRKQANQQLINGRAKFRCMTCDNSSVLVAQVSPAYCDCVLSCRPCLEKAQTQKKCNKCKIELWISYSNKIDAFEMNMRCPACLMSLAKTSPTLKTQTAYQFTCQNCLLPSYLQNLNQQLH